MLVERVAEPRPVDEPTRRRRRYGWWPLAAVPLAVALVTGATYAATYDPLSEGGLSAFAEVESVESDDGSSRFVLPYRDRVEVFGVLSVRNDGRWPVRVERVGKPSHPGWSGLVQHKPDRNGLRAQDGTKTPFAPFTLGAGDEQMVLVSLWLDNCESNATGLSVTTVGVPVRYRAFGMADTKVIPLRIPWEVRLVPGSRCPREQVAGPGGAK